MFMTTNDKIVYEKLIHCKNVGHGGGVINPLWGGMTHGGVTPQWEVSSQVCPSNIFKYI